jgi:hypothetical protein
MVTRLQVPASMDRSSSLGGPTVALAMLVVLAPLVGAAGATSGGDASLTVAAVGESSVGGPAAAAGGGAATEGQVVARAGGTLAAGPTPTENTTARVELASFRVRRTEFETVRIGTASTLQIGADSARHEHRRIAVRQAFEDADDASGQRNVIDSALIDLRDGGQELRARERAAIRAYGEGNITAATLVRRLARIDAEARELLETLEMVSRLTNRIPTDDFEGPIREVRSKLEPLRGPVRYRVRRALSGEATPVRVHVVASREGVVLETLTGGQYLREATDWSKRNVSAQPELDYGDYSDIGARVEELYPWVTSRRSNPEFDQMGVSAWRFRATHPQGELITYVDTSTTDVYREVQRLNVDEMPSTMTVVRTGAGLRVTLHRTYPGGPLRLLVEDGSTDTVVNANVTVDGYPLGRIGADGVVMTIEPETPYTVNVTASGSAISIRMERPFNGTEE